MSPIDHFRAVWQRCDELKVLHSFLDNTLTLALVPNEMLRAEWAARVSALDLYVHELVATRMLETFDGLRPPSVAFGRFAASADLLMRTRHASDTEANSRAFDLEIRNRLSLVTYQSPDNIADGIRLISDIELWNEIALANGATASTKQAAAKALKLGLSLIVERRNKIVHEGDLQPSVPRIPWAINRADVDHVSSVIEKIVVSIDDLI